MKIRTKEDVEKLDIKIQKELGIDVRKYRNEEVVENFADLIVFPKYVINWVVRPIIISFVLFIIGFFVIDLVQFEFIIYAIVGLILFLIIGILAGLLFLTQKMKTDMWGIINYSLDIMKSSVNDLNLVNNQITKENRKDVLGLLFQGIIHMITIPMVSKIISDKVPFIGKFINGIIYKILTLVADKVKFGGEISKQEIIASEDDSNLLTMYSYAITSATTGLNKLMNITFGIARFPLKMAFGIIALLLLLFLYIIH